MSAIDEKQLEEVIFIFSRCGKYTNKRQQLLKKRSYLNGLFRQSLNGTGNGTGTNAFLDITVILSHYNGTGTGTGTRNLTNGFPTHSGTYMVNLKVNLQGNFNVSLWSQSWSQSRCSVKGAA